MNRFLKITMLASLVLVVAGGVFAVAGKVSGGAQQLNEMFDRNEFSFPIRGNIGREWESNMDFDRSHPILAGDFSEEFGEKTAGDIRNLDVDMAGAGFFLYESGDDRIRIEGTETGKTQYYVEDGTLYIRACSRQKWDGPMYEGCVYLYLPKNMAFEEADLEMGAGEMSIEFLNTQDLSCEVGAGALYFSGLKAADASLEVGMGSLSIWDAEVGDMDFAIDMGSMDFSGKVGGDLNGECGMGSVTMEIDGRVSEHNYCVEASMGSIVIEGNDYSGLGVETNVDNGAASDFDLTTSMGSMEIYFTNAGM